MRDAVINMMLEKMITDAADEFVKMAEPVIKNVDMSRMTNEDLLMHCKRAFEAGTARGASLVLSIYKSLGM